MAMGVMGGARGWRARAKGLQMRRVRRVVQREWGKVVCRWWMEGAMGVEGVGVERRWMGLGVVGGLGSLGPRLQAHEQFRRLERVRAGREWGLVVWEE